MESSVIQTAQFSSSLHQLLLFADEAACTDDDDDGGALLVLSVAINIGVSEVLKGAAVYSCRRRKRRKKYIAKRRVRGGWWFGSRQPASNPGSSRVFAKIRQFR